jgi:hypothetical protein
MHGVLSDVRVGDLWKLVLPQGQCGKENIISPEILYNCESFDGFAVNLWAAGVLLFIMLVGLHPVELASTDDAQFCMIHHGGSQQLIEQWQRPISLGVIDLL